MHFREFLVNAFKNSYPEAWIRMIIYIYCDKRWETLRNKCLFEHWYSCEAQHFHNPWCRWLVLPKLENYYKRPFDCSIRQGWESHVLNGNYRIFEISTHLQKPNSCHPPYSKLFYKLMRNMFSLFFKTWKLLYKFIRLGWSL